MCSLETRTRVHRHASSRSPLALSPPANHVYEIRVLRKRIGPSFHVVVVPRLL